MRAVLILLACLISSQIFAGEPCQGAATDLSELKSQVAAISTDLERSECYERAAHSGVDFSATKKLCDERRASDSRESDQSWLTHGIAESWSAADTVAAVAAVVATDLQKPCIMGDKFSVHKLVHLFGTAAVTGAVATYTNRPDWGILAGIGVGAAREIYKNEHENMHCEWMSMAYDAAGVLVGTEAALRFTITPTRDGVQAWVTQSY